MSCCRKRPMAQSVQNTTGPCKKLEQGGANLRFWVKNVGGTHKLFLRGEDGNLVEVLSYMGAYGCDGPVSRMIERNLPRVISALQGKPAVFLRRGTSGISLTELLQTADAALKTGRASNGRVHPFARR